MIMNDTMAAERSDAALPLPATTAIAADLVGSRHIGVARFGIAVRLDETMQVTDVLVPLTASGLTGPEIGHELSVALERARIKAAEALRARCLAVPALAASIVPGGPVDAVPEPETVARAYASDDGVATVYRIEGGPIRSVVLAVGNYVEVGELTEPVRQAATRALTDSTAHLESQLASFDEAMGRIERTLTDLDRHLEAAVAG